MPDPFFRAMAERAVARNPPTESDFSASEGETSAPASGRTRGRKGLHPLLILAPAAAQAVDAYSTQQGLHRGGTHEGNAFMEPFADNPAAMYATKAAAGLLGGLLADKIARSGHPTLAKIIDGIEIAVPLGAAASNATKGRR